MKKLFLSLIATSLLASCKKEPDPVKETPQLYICTTCAQASEAKPQHDLKSSGVYKGVLAGSTGTLAFYLHNSGTEIKSFITFNNKKIDLTTTALSSWTGGKPIDTAKFTGKLEGKDVEVVFSVSANGRDGVAKVIIPGHVVTATIYKETSTTLLKNFEGDYSGPLSGVFNIAQNGNEFSLIMTGQGGPIQDRLINNEIDFISENGIKITGKFYTDEAGGTWKNLATGQSGGWKALRTL